MFKIVQSAVTGKEFMVTPQFNLLYSQDGTPFEMPADIADTERWVPIGETVNLAVWQGFTGDTSVWPEKAV